MACAEAAFDGSAAAALTGRSQIQARSQIARGRNGLRRAFEEVFRRAVWKLIRELSGRRSGVNVYAPFDGSHHSGPPRWG
jgi:hypothetical protein